MITISDTGHAHALGRLISDVQEANGWSYADIARNAVMAGSRLSKSRVESLRNGALTSVSARAIEALAAGLRVAPQRVAAAALDSMGFATSADATTAAEALLGDPALSDGMRRVLLAALAAAQHESRAAGAEAEPLISGGEVRALRRSQLTAGNEPQQTAADEDGG